MTRCEADRRAEGPAAGRCSDVFPVPSRTGEGRRRIPARVVMFDLDGTLIDTMGAFADVAAAVLAEHHGMPPLVGRRRYLQTSGIPFFEQLEEIFPGHPHNAAAARIFEVAKLTATSMVEVSACTREALRALRRRGAAVVVSSNNWQRQVDRFVETSGVEVDLALGYGDGLSKGAPHFRLVEERFAVRPDEILFVGDSLHDARLAKVAGTRFAARLGTFSPWDFSAESPGSPQVSEIVELVPLVDAAPRVAAE